MRVAAVILIPILNGGSAQEETINASERHVILAILRTSVGKWIMKGRGIFVCVWLLTYAVGSSAESRAAGPQLSIARGTNWVALRWPPTDQVYLLENSDAIGLDASWRRTGRPSFDGEAFRVRVDFEPGGEGAPNQFFRLRESLTTPTIVAGSHQTLLLKGDGSLWTWGQIANQVGQGTPSPIPIDEAGGFTAIASGDLHNAALDLGAAIWAWGDNDSGQLGSGIGNRSEPTPVRAGPWKKVAASGALTLALHENGTIAGSGVIAFVPPHVITWESQISPDDDWIDIATGGQYACNYYSPCEPATCGAVTHCLALKRDGTLWAWGENTFGQLGQSSIDDQHVPIRIGDGTNWIAISAGEGHSLGLQRNGTLWAWGWNAHGQLGIGTLTDRSEPVQVGTNTNWSTIAAGYRHSVALQTDGSLWAWGCNGSGQLGNGTTSSTNSPILIGTENDWLRIAAGAEHTVAIKTDGGVWTWGGNQLGQLGDGTLDARLSPVQVNSVKY
jgi:alpha-tubulin suppressor-like RCC1 family protein